MALQTKGVSVVLNEVSALSLFLLFWTAESCIAGGFYFPFSSLYAVLADSKWLVR